MHCWSGRLAAIRGSEGRRRPVSREEQEFNARFVRAVEKQPCLYDFSVAGYSDRERQERAWGQIANEVSATGQECKERWRNLRSSLTRHLKRGGKRPFYLAREMEFVVPFTKTRSRAVLPFLQDGLEDFFTVGHLEDEKSVQIEDDITLLGEPTVESTLSPLAQDDGTPASPSSEADLRTKRPRGEEPDPDINFFLALLPDIRAMSPAQKRKMRIGLLKLIDDLLT